MDNCRIHHSDFVIEAINKRGYKPLFLPSYSPFLNPIAECWAKVKRNTGRNQLSKLDQLTPRIAGAYDYSFNISTSLDGSRSNVACDCLNMFKVNCCIY
jgi:transposase